MSKSSMADDRGWALVSTLGVVLLLSLLAAAAQQISSGAYRAERRATADTQADALLEAGVTRGVLGLLDANMANRWAADGVQHLFDFAGSRLQITVQDESGKIDINASDTTTLTRLFRAAGLNEENSETLADRIADWRSSSTLKHLHGATDEDYASAGYHWHPRHGAFQSVDELQLVMGMTADTFAKVAPALTVYTGRATIDPAVAPKLVLQTLAGASESEAEHILAERQSHERSAVEEMPLNITAAGALQGKVYTVSVEVSLGPKSYAKAAVIELSDSAQRYFVLA